MEIQKINSIQTICLNGKKYWRAFVPSEDCFKTFAELSSSSRVFACSEDFLLITDDENKVFLFEKKDDSVKQVHLNEPFMKSVFGEENTDSFILIELPETNLLICQEKIFLCKSYNVDKDIFKAKIIEDGKEKDLEAWYGYKKDLVYSIS